MDFPDMFSDLPGEVRGIPQPWEYQSQHHGGLSFGKVIAIKVDNMLKQLKNPLVHGLVPP